MDDHRRAILKLFSLLSLPDGGIGSWLSETTGDDIFRRLSELKRQPLSKVQLNQLLAFAHEAPLSRGFFRYYWLVHPSLHPYNIASLPVTYDDSWMSMGQIVSLDHLYWGLYRLYVDGLLWFGNVRTAYRALRTKTFEELHSDTSPTRDSIRRA